MRARRSRLRRRSSSCFAVFASACRGGAANDLLPDAGVSPQAKAEPAQLENVAVTSTAQRLTLDAGPLPVPLRADEEAPPDTLGQGHERLGDRSHPPHRRDPAGVSRTRDRDRARSTPRRRRPSCASRSTSPPRAPASRCEGAGSRSPKGPSFARGATATGTSASPRCARVSRRRPGLAARAPGRASDRRRAADARERGRARGRSAAARVSHPPGRGDRTAPRPPSFELARIADAGEGASALVPRVPRPDERPPFDGRVRARRGPAPRRVALGDPRRARLRRRGPHPRRIVAAGGDGRSPREPVVCAADAAGDRRPGDRRVGRACRVSNGARSRRPRDAARWVGPAHGGTRRSPTRPTSSASPGSTAHRSRGSPPAQSSRCRRSSAVGTASPGELSSATPTTRRSRSPPRSPRPPRASDAGAP